MTEPHAATPVPAIAPARTCRWIDGDVREPGWRYCDLPTIG